MADKRSNAQREITPTADKRSRERRLRLRRTLYLAAVVAMRANPILRTFAARLLAAGKPKMAVVGAVMRKLLHQAYGVLKHATPFNPNLEFTP